MKKITPYLGWIGLSIGVLVAVTSFLPGNLAKIAFFGMLPGFLCSSAYVLFSTRFQVQPKGFNPGIAGMLLNSTPFAIILYMQMTK
ncbi:MAG: hypothetical protein M3R17_18050 [Bacteroidota bacterium]|nr:hypothetical protein [Bacteroidota bacterium]